MFRLLSQSAVQITSRRLRNVQQVAALSSSVVARSAAPLFRAVSLNASSSTLVAAASSSAAFALFSQQQQRSYASAAHGLTQAEVTERAIKVVKGFERVDPQKVTATSHFANDLGLDSLDAVEVVMAFEDEFW